MDAKKYHSILILFLIAVLCTSLINVQMVHADGETPTEPPVPTQVETEPPLEPPVAETAPPTEPAVATELPTEVPIVETPVPEEATVVLEEVTETPVVEVLSQVPENTDVVVLDANGNKVPLVSQEAAEIVEVNDPMWCPAGVLPGDARCSSPYGRISDLLRNMRENPSFYDEAGVIYFTSSAGGSLLLTDQAGSLGSVYDTLKNFDLTIQGGWNGNTVSPSFSGQTDFANYRIIIGTGTGTNPNPWVGNLTLNDLAFSGGNTTAVSVYTTEGDITLNNVDVTGHLNSFTAVLDSETGDVIVQNSTFAGNPGAQSRGFYATTGGSVNISNTSFTEAGTRSGNGYDGATLDAPVVTLTNVTASDNDGSGVFVTGSRLIIIGGTFVNNQGYGVEVGNPASTAIYIQSDPTCTGNGSGCYNDATIFDHTVPVLTPIVTGATEVNGWYGGDVSVNWSASDAESGILSSNCPSVTLNTETAGTTVTCSATNNAGLSNSASITIRIDKTGPILSSSDITTEATGPAGAVVSYSVSATDAVDGPVPASCSPVSGSTFPVGSTTVTCSASDLRGNTSGDSFLVTVNDTAAPVIEPLADIITSSYRKSGKHIYYPSPTTSDIVDGAGVATCSPASGALFPIGDTQVTCTATDAHGNSVTSTFTVRVNYETVLPPIPDAPTLPVIVIPATGGELINLDCNSVFWAFGVKLAFVNLCDQQATIHEVKAGNLPAALPDGFSFVMGVSVDVLTNGKLLKELPKDSNLQMNFPMAGEATDQFAILYWNGSEWVTISEQKGNDQLPQILNIAIDKPGIYVLVKK